MRNLQWNLIRFQKFSIIKTGFLNYFSRTVVLKNKLNSLLVWRQLHKCFKMAAFNRRRFLVYALYIYQRNRETEGVLKKSLSVLLFMESRRIFLIQQYLNHLKNLLWCIISSEKNTTKTKIIRSEYQFLQTSDLL